MNQLTIIERIKEQEELARKFHEVESRILTVLDFGELCEALVGEIAAQFAIPQVWLTLVEDVEAVGILKQTGRLDRLGRRLRVVERPLFEDLPQKSCEPLLLNEDLGRFYRLWPRGTERTAGSLALAPISLDGVCAGSLNLADPDRGRFRPGLRTDFLERLALKVSICLSNVTAHEKLKLLAYRDPLTGLYNRRIMETVLAREIARARRYSSPLSVVFIDLNDFKLVNDTYGHDCGDDLLRHLAQAMLATCRDSDLVSRYAGDEFIILLPDQNLEGARFTAERLQAMLLKNPLLVSDRPIPLKASIGLASSEDLAQITPRALLKRADQALYAQKRLKRQRFEVAADETPVTED